MSIIPIISIADAKTYLDVESSDTQYDTIITNLVKQATNQIHTETRIKYFKKQSYTDYFNSKSNTFSSVDLLGRSSSLNGVYAQNIRRNKFYLSTINIDSTADFKVYYDTTREFAESSLVDSSSYYVDYDKGILNIEFGTTRHNRSVKVVYTGGYESIPAVVGEPEYIGDTIPQEIKDACRTQVIHLFDRYSQKDISLRARGRETKIRGIMSNEAKELLSQYKRVMYNYV